MKLSKLLYSTMVLLVLVGPVLAGINDGLVAFYPFNGNANEATGSGPNGTVVGATLTEDRYGNTDSAYNFDGVNDYIHLGNSLNFPAWDTYSVSLWFLHDGGGNTTTGYGQKILSKGQFFSDFHLHVATPGYLYWWSAQGDFTSIGDTSNDYRDNTWHHVVINMFYVNANERWGEMWVDGILKVSGTLWKVTNAVDLLIGYTAHTDGFQQRYWSGKIDDIRVYDRTLTDAEIGELFTLSVDIDVKPGSDPNCFNINGHGVIPVAILGDEGFDVSQVDKTSLSFGGLEVRVRGNKGALCSIEYSNDDTYLDLVCHFEDDVGNWVAGDGEATLTGTLLDGTPIEGTDSICVVP